MDKRFLRGCLVIFLVGILGIIFSSPKSYVDKYDFEECQVHIVKSGETLWTICDSYCPDEIDLREYIELVKELSGKADDSVYVGEELLIPIIAEYNPSVSNADSSLYTREPVAEGGEKE